jgi:hypothetical protein
MTASLRTFACLCCWAAVLPALTHPGLQAQEAAASKAGDAVSLDATLGSFYEIISGAPGQKRDWVRFRALFAPGARLVRSGRSMDGKPAMVSWEVEDYIAVVGAKVEADGLFESEIARRTEHWGSIAQVFSSFESRRSKTDPLGIQRGINAIQLRFDGSRWWIINLFWEAERGDNPLPDRFMHSVPDADAESEPGP